MKRTLKNSFWYFVILCIGIDYVTFMPNEWYSIPLLFIVGIFTYHYISKLRRMFKF